MFLSIGLSISILFMFMGAVYLSLGLYVSILFVSGNNVFGIGVKPCTCI